MKISTPESEKTDNLGLTRII